MAQGKMRADRNSSDHPQTANPIQECDVVFQREKVNNHPLSVSHSVNMMRLAGKDLVLLTSC